MANTTRPGVAGAQRRDFILIDPKRHKQWVGSGHERARREGIPDAQLLTVTQPTLRWFAEAGLAMPDEAVLTAFAQDGIVVLHQVEAPSILPYRPEVFAEIAVDAAIAEAEQVFAVSVSRTADVRPNDQVRLRSTAVLTALDTPTPDARTQLFRDAYRRSSTGQINPGPFEDLERNHLAALTEALDRVWQARRVDLEARAAIRHNDPMPSERRDGLRGFWARIKSLFS
jgi:hypothetical protein